MNYEKRPFEELIDIGRSMVWMPTEKDQDRLADMLNTPNNNNIEKICVIKPKEVDVKELFKEWDAPLQWDRGRVMIIVPPTFAQGFRFQADRSIWVGERPTTPAIMRTRSDAFAIYIQCMARCNMPWGQPAKWHYEMNEVFPLIPQPTKGFQ